MTHATLKTLAQRVNTNKTSAYCKNWAAHMVRSHLPPYISFLAARSIRAAAGLLRTASRLGLHPPSMPHQRNALTRKKRGVATERGFRRQKSVPKILTTANGPCSHPWPRDFSAPESHFYQLSRTDGRKDVGFRLSRRSLGQISREPRGASRNLSIRLRFSSKWASYLRMRSNKRQSD